MIKPFTISSNPKGATPKPGAVASATVLNPGELAGLTSGLLVRPTASTAKLVYVAGASAAGETEDVQFYDDPDIVLKGKADAAFAVTNRGAEVDLVIVPGYLTTGTVTATALELAAISDASFRVTIAGTAYNVDAIDLTSGSPTTYAAIAALIQAALRVATSALETVTWDSTNSKFVVTSAVAGDTGTVSELSTSTGTVGTDISGASYLNGQEGAGVVTAPRQSIDLGASTTDVFKVEPGTDAGVVGSTDDILVRLNKPV